MEKVLTLWGSHLSPVEKCAAVHMANTAHDHHTPPVYWAGWKALAVALGYAHGEANRGTARANTMSVFSQLRTKGVITSGGNARPGANGVYALNLDPDTEHVPVNVSGDGREVTWRTVSRNDPRAARDRAAPAWMGSGDDYPVGSGDDYPVGSGDDYPESTHSNELHQVGKGAAAAHPTGPSVPPGREAGELTLTTETEEPPPDVDDWGGWTGWGTPAPAPAPAEEGDNRTMQERKNEQSARLRAAYPGTFAA